MGKKKLIPPIDQLQAEATKILLERNGNMLRKMLTAFLSYYEPLNYCFTYGAPLWRIRKSYDPNGFATTSEVHYPPSHCTKAGRMNEPGLPILYVTFTPFTAMKEVNAKIGDHLHMISYTMREDRPIRTLLLGEFTNVHKGGQGNLSNEIANKLEGILGKMDFEPGLSFIFMDAFLSSILSDPKMADANYTSIEAIEYPSVARVGSMNLAIKPEVADEALQINWTSVIRIDNQFDHGLYRYTVVRTAEGFWGDGIIDWKDNT